MRLFFIISTFLMFAFGAMPAQAGEAAAAPCPECTVYHTLPAARPQPTHVALVCLPFRQPEASRVVIFIYGADGNITYTHAKQAARNDQYCIGAWRISDATSRIVLCNGDATATLSRARIAELRAKGSVPHGAYLCLFGAACAAMH